MKRALLLFCLTGLTGWTGGEEELPPGWSRGAVATLPDSQVEGISGRLGGKIVSIENRVLSIHGFRGQINVVMSSSEAEAEKVENGMLRLRGSDFTVRKGLRVFEFAGNNVLLARRLHALVDPGRKREAKWNVSFRAGLIEKPDFMEINPVFNLFLSREKASDREAVEKEIREITGDWTMGSSLSLRTAFPGGFQASWRFTPEPLRSEERDGVTTFHFPDPPTLAGVPYVEVRGTVQTEAMLEPREGEGPGGLTDATASWPVNDEQIATLVGSITRSDRDPRRRLSDILGWIHRSIGGGNGPLGSRFGTLEVLRRRAGRCWDKSDLLVTLCRAAGLPARQVAGWVPPLKAGHVWAEVWLEGQGWIGADGTCPWDGVSEDYLPWYVTEDGMMPLLYLSMPRVARESS